MSEAMYHKQGAYTIDVCDAVNVPRSTWLPFLTAGCDSTLLH